MFDWYMKFVQVPTRNPQNTLAERRMGLIDEFKKPKSKSQYIIELQEIKQFPNESVWDFGQRFKILITKVSFGMSDLKHKEWFITALVPHIYMSLM